LNSGPAQQAALLAVLLARVGQPTSIDQLIELVWGESPPASALNTIYKYVGALRHMLEPDLPARETGAFLQRRGDSYVFIAERDMLDLSDFRTLVHEARRARSEQEEELALGGYLQALSLWNGEVGTGVGRMSTSPPVFAAINAELVEACIAAGELGVSLGEPARVLPALRFAAAMEPFHEPLHACLISALGAAGRQSEAVAVFAAIRERLADELGLDPGEALNTAHRELLAGRARMTDATAPRELGWTLPEDRARLVGRVKEHAALWKVAESALLGDSGLAVLEGEPGIGKTRLLQTVGEDAASHDMLVAWGRPTTGGGTPALWPWLRIATTLLRGLPPAERDARIIDELRLRGDALSAILATPVLPDSGAKFRLFERIAAIVERAATRRPLLIIVDDLQFADPASLELFTHISARLPRGAALIGSFRSHAPIPAPELARLLADVSRSPLHRRIRLNPFTAEEVLELLQKEISPDVGAESARALHGRSGGNPFFALELARLTPGDSAAALRTIGRVPSTVVDVVRDRMSDLDFSAKEIVEFAATIGRDVDVKLLARAVDLDERTCLDRLQPVEDLGLIVPNIGNPGIVSFAHDIVREAVIAITPNGQRQRMHLAIADALEGTGPVDDLASEMFAHHLWSAGALADCERTSRALLRAGRASAARCAFESAEEYLGAAADIARSAGLADAELAALADLIAAVGMRAGYVGAALGHVERAERLARELGRGRDAADLLFTRFTALCQGIQLDDAGRLARRLLAQGEASQDPVVRAYGWMAWGVYQWDVGGIGESREYLARADALTFGAGVPDVGWNLRRDLRLLWPVWVANTTAVHGDLSAAAAILDDLDAAAEDDLYAQTVGATFAVVIAALAGDPEWAARAAARGISIDPEWTYGFLGCYQRLGLYWARAIAGDSPSEMAAAAEGIITAAMVNPPASGLPTWYCLLAEMRLAANEIDAASTALESAEQYFGMYGQRYAEGLLLLLRAKLMRARGESEGAVVAAAGKARELSAERGAHLFVRRTEDFLAELQRGSV
jgi:DNA-binding SARP family transcriptional activator